MPEVRNASTHPPLPPTTEDDRVSWLRLLRSRRVGATTFHRMLAEHGTASTALAALPDVAKAVGVDNYQPCPEAVALAELKAGRAAGARMICFNDPEYPAALRDLTDAPPVLWAIGDTGLMQKQMVAMVGARNASSLGTRMARGLAADLGGRGLVVVSGLARGIDAAAHLAALETGTIAVLAGGVDVKYPAENTKLAEQIAQRGLLLSEMPMGFPPRARDFPRRNRIISGLSSAVVVIEAAAKSGSLITARNALDQGREVLAVPGHPLDPRGAGGNMLIRDGARLIRNGEDVLESLPVKALVETGQTETGQTETGQTEASIQTPQKRNLTETAALHQQILKRLGPTPVAEDQLIRDLAAPAGNVTPVLVHLELEGRIARHPGGLLSRQG